MGFTPSQIYAIDVEEKKNVLVSAGAGSGKTTVLSERVLRKVKSGINIDEILILTFTKAAAASMKNKIRKRLIEENLIDQINLLDKAYITTFDSFTNSIIKKYHDRLNLAKDIKVVDTNSINLYKEKELDRIFNRYYEEKNALFEKLISDFCLKNDKEIRPLIILLNDKLDLRYDKEEYLKSYLDNYYSEEFVSKCVLEFNDLVFSYVYKIKEALKCLEFSLDSDDINIFYEQLNSLLNAKDYKEVKNSLDVKLPEFRSKKYTDEDKYFKKVISESLDELKSICVLNPDTLVSDYIDTKDYLKIIIDILLELDNSIKEFKYSNNTFEFIDLAKMAITLVKENKDIKEELTNSFKEIMIDEYQDTSDLQEVLIREIESNNLYMVGDIKQSIYRFRNANPDIFKQKYLDYEKDNTKGIKIDLNKNFRSREEDLIDINTIFDNVMDLEYGGANYKESHRMTFGNTNYIKTEQNYNLEIYDYKVDKESIYKKYNYYEIEAFIIGNDIINKINNKYQIYDKEEKKLRDIKYSDFSIIVDRAKSFDTYKKIFEYLNIPLTVYKKENIAESIELYLLKNILKLIESKDIDDTFKYSFVSIARSYLFNYSDQDIYDIINNNTYNDTDIIKKINIIKEEISYLDLKNLIIRIKDIFEFNTKAISVGNIDIRISTLEYFINLAKDLSSLNYDYHDFIEYIDSIIESDAKIEIPVSIESDNSASIMTIHASKGLEYRVCYFPEMANTFNMQDVKAKVFYDKEYGITLPSFNLGYADTFIKTLARKKYIKEEVSEKIRLFYVALTRVEEKMIIISSIDKEDIKDKINYRSFLDIIKTVKEDINSYIKEVNLDDMNISDDYLKMIVSCLDEYPYQELDVSEYKDESSIEEDSHFSKEIKELITKDKKKNMEYGTKIHQIFELIDFKNVDLSKYDISSKEKEYINNFLNQDLLKNIKDAKILKEYEFYYDNKHGIIDLMLEYLDHIDIIDYKLKHVTDIEYINQLNGYKEYIKNKTNKDVNIYLYSILDNTFKSLND